jgi:hypothetical protein
MALLTTPQMLTGIKNWVMGKIANITALIPSQASAQNQLADKAFVNSSVATATATFRGTYNLVTDLGLTTAATQQQMASALASKIITADNNDYAFVQIPTSDITPTEIAKTERYKFNGSVWSFEYELNNSGFSAAEWAAIDSGITSAKVTKLDALPNNAELTTLLNNKANKITVVNQSASSVAINPNVLNVWGAISSLSITFSAGASDEVNEYMFQFTCPSNAGTILTLPDTVKWANDDELEPEPGHTYQVSILDNLALYAGWEAQSNA